MAWRRCTTKTRVATWTTYLFRVPTERYGFSNNKRPAKFAAPSFEACRFVIDKPVVKIRITLK